MFHFLTSPLTDPNQKASVHGASLYPLDGIRGLAVLVVILSHTEAFGMYGQGSVGVLLFFALSGFVLALPYTDRPERILSWSEVWRFFANRVLRIVPIFVVAVVYMGVWIGVDPNWYITHLTFVAGWNHFWSVVQEARFYVLFPLVIAALAIIPKGARIPLVVALVLAAYYLRTFHTVDSLGSGMIQFYFWVFLSGILASLIYRSGWVPTGSETALSVASLAFLLCFYLLAKQPLEAIWPNAPAMNGWSKPELWCGIFVVLLVTVTVQKDCIPARFLALWPMRHLGLLSYSLYLFHMPVISHLKGFGMMPGNSMFLVTIAASYVVAYLSYILIEKPFLRLKPKPRRDLTASLLSGDTVNDRPNLAV